MKKLIAILTLALCLPFAGCDDVSMWPSPDLGRNSIAVSRTEGTSISIASGSGDYSASIDDKTIAEVSVEPAYGIPPQLVIEPLKEGEAEITVTDKRSGLKATLALKVAKYTSSFKIQAIEFSVDADNNEAIEADLEADASVPPVGGAILSSNWNEVLEWAFTNADGEVHAHFTITDEELTEENPIFEPLKAGTQMITKRRFILLDKDGGQRELDMYVFSKPLTRMNMPMQSYQYRFMEDLTEYYKAEFPEAGVRSVARVLISNGAN